MGKRTLAEKFSEAAVKPVPDETLTVAWWDCDAQSDVVPRRPEVDDANSSRARAFKRLLEAAARKRGQEL